MLVVGIAFLRIPGLRYGSGRMAVYLSVLWLLDAVLMGKFQVSLGEGVRRDLSQSRCY